MTFRARRLPLHRGPAAWDAILPNKAKFPTLETNLTADIAIIGGGFAGLSAARRLHELNPNLQITVLEAGGIAEGASGRNSGFMIDLPHELTSEDYAGAGDDRQIIALNRQAQSFAKNAVEAYRINPAYFDPIGKINGAVSDAAHAHNISYLKHLATLGEHGELLDSKAMQEATGSAYYTSGVFTPGTVMLQPAGYIRGLAQGLARDGVQIFENSPALSFTQTEDWHITTPKGTLIAPKIILAVNGFLESFGVAQGHLMQLFLFGALTPDLDPSHLKGHARWGITPSDPMGTSMRRIDTAQGGNRILTRSAAVLRSGMKARPSDLTRAARLMQQKFDARFPHLAGLKMEYTWAGHLCLSLNSVSITGEIASNVYSACVQNGLGTARGTLTGIAAAEQALNHKSDITNFFETEASPKRLPPRPMRDIGANTVLRWREWKARKE